MAAVKAGDVERVLRARPPAAAVLLLYGPDAGRVNERARRCAEAAVDDPADPFQLVRMDGDDLADRPGRLFEEATTYGMFGSRRALWVRPTSRNIAGAVASCLDLPALEALVVIEAGDLSKSSPLRVLCEKAPRALALPCYGDESRDLGGLVDELLREARLAIDPEARELLIDSLGADRLATRGEVAKLALYALGRERVTRADVEAVIVDVSALSVDAAIDAAFGGHGAALDANLTQLASHGTAPAAILATALRHGLSLVAARNVLDETQDLDAALRGWRGLFHKRKDAIARQVRAWPSRPLGRAVAWLQDATLTSRTSPGLAAPVAARSLVRIAETAASLSRR